jgi:hypothetical protein
MQYEYKVITIGNHDYHESIEETLNELGKKGWKVFHIERMNKDNYYNYPKAIYYLIKETDENIIITK